MESVIELGVQSDFLITGNKIGDYYYNEVTDTIAYDLPYFFPCKFKVRKLKRIIVTPAMKALPGFLKYHNIAFLTHHLRQLDCIRQGALLVHGAVWKQQNLGCLAVGFPNSGKTSLSLSRVSDGAVFCSDEQVIIKDGIAYPVAGRTSLSPWVANHVHYPLSRKQKIDFMFKKARAKVLPIFEPNIWVDLPYKREPVKIERIIWLTPGKKKSLALLLDNEFPWFTDPVIQTYSYATGLDLDKIYAEYRRLIDDVERLDSFC